MKIMTTQKARKIQALYTWMRIFLLVLFLTFLYAASAHAQGSSDSRGMEERLTRLEKMMQSKTSKFMPGLHGILRGKFEYEPDLNAGRFEVRNARLSVVGKLPLCSEYKMEIDLCDEGEMKMKDAWVRVTPWKTLRLSLGQQRMPFSIDAHRNPSAQFFANRSFIAKQVGDMRDVGFLAGFDFTDRKQRKVASLDAGIFNGSNLNNQKSAWFTSPGYSARLQYYPVPGLSLVPSVQNQQIADRQASYTSLDMGVSFQRKGWLVEAEFLHKFYAKDAFHDCNALNTMLGYDQFLKKEKSLVESIGYLARYDYMQDHSSGKSGMEGSLLKLTDAERHRLTLGVTFALRNPYFPTHLRLNYEKYWYPHGGAKESEQDKLVCELMIKF